MNREKQCPQCKMKLHPVNNTHIGSKSCWGDGVLILNEETEAIWSYWKVKRQRKAPSNKQFLLSATEMVQLFSDAGITANDIGRGLHQYQLARHNDTGHYEMGNCRFITAGANRAERCTQKNQRAVKTPLGEFPSVRSAAKEHGMDKASVTHRLRSNGASWSQWHYASTEGFQM